MDDTIRVTELVLTTKEGTKITLTVDEARDLYSQLSDLFYRSPPVSPYPLIVERERYPWVPPGFYNPTCQMEEPTPETSVLETKFVFTSGLELGLIGTPFQC